MTWIDWAIVAAYLIYVVVDGVRMSRRNPGVEGYFLANRSLPWWAVGLSVIATQMSAITLVGTTGQAYADGMRFIQFYFGLPLAMVILSITVVPFFYRARVYTAYEYLERRFDARTRTLTSFLFLISRGLSVGVIVAAPSLILSIVFGWSHLWTILAMGISTTAYTMFGGVTAVTWTDVKQMVVIFVGLGVALWVIFAGLPADVSLTDALHLAGATGRLTTVSTKFDLHETYTLWSGLIGGIFLMLGYFGCDQSQVQRYLTARSVSEGRTSLLMSAFVKIPIQFVILLIGVMVFVYYQFTPEPMIFDRAGAQRAEQQYGREYAGVQGRFEQRMAERTEAARAFARSDGSEEARKRYLTVNAEVTKVRSEAAEIVRRSTPTGTFSDVNNVFPTFILTQMPTGAIGLLIAAIFAAAMSSIAAELNALSTASVIDVYRRHFRPDQSERHYLFVSKIATAFWGLFACAVAYNAAQLGSLIEVVNKFGSFFYGSLVGVFALAIGTRRATGRGATWGLLSGIASVALVSYFGEIASGFQALTGSKALVGIAGYLDISFLWYNVIGAVVVVVVGLALSRRS